jgi:16S rRNA (guanine966-N2)-methyltransferase
MHNRMMSKTAFQPGAASNTKPLRGQVRLIGGQWKRSVIAFTGTNGLRPTPDRVRETVFNWLGQDLSGLTVLDAFSGTGALALEAASRGAARVVALETNALAAQTIADHVRRLGGAQRMAVIRAEALRWMAQCSEQFDVVFLDPPFAENLYPKLAEIAPQVLKPSGALYVEAPEPLDAFGDWVQIRHARAGAVHYHLFKATRALNHP